MRNLISIIMPVYNGSRFVAEAIESVLYQDYNNWELLIINDGSVDDSEEIILNFTDARISYFSQENKGVSSARNVGLFNMSGDFFCFLDADDVLTSESLSSRLAMFKTSPQVMFVDGRVAVCDETFQHVYKEYIPKKVDDLVTELCNLSGSVFFGPSWMLRRQEKIKYSFDPSITHGEDLYFYIKYASHGLLGYCDQTILKYRTGHTSAMNNLDGLEQGYREILKKISNLNHVTENNMLDFKKKSKSIMFKSYLGNFKPFSALRVLFTW